MRLSLATLILLSAAVVSVCGDLDSWNNGTSSNIRVGGITSQSFTNTARIFGGDGDSSNPSFSFISAPTLGFYKASAFNVGLVGNLNMSSATLNIVNASGSLVLGNPGDTVLVRDGANTLQLGSDAASPSSQTLKANDGSGTDKNGGNLTVEGGQSTGAGRGGAVIIQTAVTSTTGSSANAYHNRARYVPKFIDLTDNTATTIFQVTLPTTNSVGIEFVCTIQASDGTDFQSLTTPVVIDAVAKSATITAVVAPTGAQTVLAASAGTLSVTYTVVDAGSNTLNVKVTADTSLSSLTYLRARLVMTAINGVGTGWSITEI